jgi:hypothetical protein
MADPTYYQVTVNVAFTTANEVFLPGKTYYVSQEVYDSTLTDGSKFSERCVSVSPIYNHP